MANKTDLDLRVKIDNESSTLTDYTSYLTSASIRGALDILEDTAINEEEKSYLPGKAGATIPIAGYVNTTTSALIDPLIGNRTSITKTIEYRAYATNSTGNQGSFHNGEVYLTNIEKSGSLNSVQMFSGEATFDGAVNVTSVALA